MLFKLIWVASGIATWLSIVFSTTESKNLRVIDLISIIILGLIFGPIPLFIALFIYTLASLEEIPWFKRNINELDYGYYPNKFLQFTKN